MTKRSSAAILISGDSVSRSRHSSLPKSSSKFSYFGPSLSKSKKARLSHSHPRPTREFVASSELKLLSEDCEEKLIRFKVSTAGSALSNGNTLWADKYKPHSVDELAVHKKKVEEVKSWIEEKFSSEGGLGNHTLLLTGPAGVGKSATVHVIASHIGAKLFEWSAPTPTLWQEHVHNANAGTTYTSKLDEFEMFVERTRKYGLFQASFGGKKTSAVMLLIDDIPLANGKCASERLKNCLQLLVRTTQVPTAILITDYSKVDISSTSCGFIEELQTSLETVGACKISFNPITVNSIKRTLSRICRQEKCSMTAEQVDMISKSCGGDIRHAITSLQYFSLKPDPLLHSHFSNNGLDYLKRQRTENNPVEYAFMPSFGRDDTFSLFHTLGKFLHNKRETEGTTTKDTAFPLKERFMRFPMKLGCPEKVLAQTHASSRHILDFLHENFSDFLNDEAVGDASMCLSYLSDADFLLSTLSRVARNFESHDFLHNAAASLAGRGVLFGNCHPAPSRWHTFRRPKLWQVERFSWHAKKGMKVGCASTSCGHLADAMVMVTELRPVCMRIGCTVDGDLDCLKEKEVEFSEDEIEDC